MRTPTAVPRTAPRHRASVLIVSGSVGAGHDGAAHELAGRLRASGVDVDVRDYMQGLPRFLDFLLRDGYGMSVGHLPLFFQWLFTAIERHRAVRALVMAVCHRGDRQVRRWAREKPYGAVVSTYPLASQSLGNLRASGDLRVPAVTYLTDPAVHRVWVHPAVDHHLTVTGWTAAQGSADYGVPMRAAGPLVPARFAVGSADRREVLARELGLDPERPVALLVTGSLGLGDVEHSAARVVEAGLVPLVLCGRNEALRERVAAVPGAVALGWRDDVHELMRVADVLVHNAGGLSFTEALVAGLPAVSYRCIPGHGRANAAALEGAGLAPWARTDEELGPVLAAQAARGHRPQLHDDPAGHVLALLSDAQPSGVVLPARRRLGAGARPVRARAALRERRVARR